ncbi:hypothetical protein EDI_335260 [Entamoeba dispar SAW760]|uniref:Transmembrane protein n=1 Tax=Entamoeba dispar (strain ATCC PRA-260 / SAW760) TaxID=370354 RepID=B0ET06_ENTDS|nr:uncharacterized protein EDI_335260 [Entamoeba dispar SAW760]EDR22369.1 hypothetical protein EDI_335260 [Entamoeba dispar SAW760]|eukprot:EDR22369.1 hypothetical protein EDI_335260 [Entamoeba dispar SAW760]
MQVIQEGILKVISIGLEPEDFFESKYQKIVYSFGGFCDMIKNQGLELNSKANERVTGYTNLLIVGVCIFSSIILSYNKTHGVYQSMNKFWMTIFNLALSVGAFFGFVVHIFAIPSDILEGLWYCLYVFLIIALMLRFFQVFWDCSVVTFILMLPGLIVFGYLDIIACWYYDKFLFIGIYVLFFGLFMGLTHFIHICTRSNKYILYSFSDLIGLISVIVQITSIRYGSWDKNGFFHLGVSVYVLMNTISFIVISLSSSKERKVKLD